LVYCRQGDRASGEKELRIALELKPDDADALRALEILEGRK
jgi:hypothetical protein